jgi:predicted RNA binding protein YcfA (HicA-like mRNA interferase family)
VARIPKPSGGRSTGPWSPDHIVKALRSAGWVYDGPPPHTQLKHPTRPGKVTVDRNWKSGVTTKHDVFHSICRQAGYSKRQLVALLDGV